MMAEIPNNPDPLTVAVIQDDIHWQDPAANRQRLDGHLAPMSSGEQANPDLVVLPEMFSTAFFMEPDQCYEEMEGETVAWMQAWAGRLDAVLTGSLVMKVGQRFVNRMIWACPNGQLKWYDKKHLFRYGGEHHNFSAGDQRTIFPLNGWRVALFVCYDLRFPVWSRNREDYDLALYVANWPDARQYAWDTLVRGRAIENQCYLAGCNRLGEDKAGNSFSGGSVVLDFLGKPMVDCGDRAMVGIQTLHYPPLQEFRRNFPAAMDADRFVIGED